MITDVTPDLLTITRPRHAVADASDLRGKFDPARGLTVRSWSGNRVAYHVANVRVDRSENEVLAWDLVAANPRDYPIITVYND